MYLGLWKDLSDSENDSRLNPRRERMDTMTTTYSKAQRGRHIVKHVLDSADMMIHAVPDSEELNGHVKDFCQALAEARRALKGEKRLPREEQVNRVGAARTAIESARATLATIMESHTTPLLTDADVALGLALSQLDTLTEFVAKRRLPYSGPARYEYPGEPIREDAVKDDEDVYDDGEDVYDDGEDVEDDEF